VKRNGKSFAIESRPTTCAIPEGQHIAAGDGA
jgi:hypothetical protein